MSVVDDLEYALTNDPLNMTAEQRERLKLKHGEDRALELFQRACSNALRRVRVVPPHMMPRRK